MVDGRVARLGHVGIAVADLDRSVTFYTEVLGMRLTELFRYDENQVGHGVAGQHRDGGLNDDRPIVHLGADIVDGAAAQPDAGLQHPLVYVDTLEARQQRRVDIDDAARVRRAQLG